MIMMMGMIRMKIVMMTIIVVSSALLMGSNVIHKNKNKNKMMMIIMIRGLTLLLKYIL